MANLTKEQVKTIIEKSPSGSDPKDIIKGLVNRGYILEGLNSKEEQPKKTFDSVPEQVAVGAGKGVLSTIKGISEIGERGVKAFGRVVTPKALEEKLGFTKETGTGAELLFPEKLTSPEGTAQKIGFLGEQIGEFLIPLKGEQVALSLLDKGLPAVQKASKAGNKLAKIAEFVAKSLGSGSEFAGKTLVQTGEPKEAITSGAIGSVVPGATSVLSGTAKALTKVLPKKLMGQIFNTTKDDLRLYYKSLAKGEEINPTLAEEALKEGIFGSSKDMAVLGFQKLDQFENQLTNFVKQSDKTVKLSNKNAYIDLLQTIRNQFQRGFYNERAKEATKLINEISSNNGIINLDSGLRLKRFLDKMRNTSSFRLDTNLAPRQSEFKDAANLIRTKIKIASPEIKDLLNKERMYIEFTDAIISDATKRANKQLLGLTDVLIGGGGIATGFTGAGLGTMAAVRGFQRPITLTGLAQFLYKVGQKLKSVGKTIEQVPKIIPPLINE